MRILRLIGMAILGATALLAGCASTSSARSEPTTGTATAPAHEGGMSMMGGMCPMRVAGTTVTSAEIEGGVALAFTTTGDVAELRQRVRRMAEMHNQHHAAPPDREAGGHDGMAMGGGGMMMPAATASVEDLEGGSQVILRPNDPAQLEALRDHARMRADRMARGECPMGEMDHGQHDSSPPGMRSMSHGMTSSTQASGEGR